MKSWREYHPLTTAGEAIETWTSPAALPHCATGEVGAGLPEGGVGLQRGGALPLAEKGTGVRVQDDIEADPEIEGTDLAPSHQLITEVTDIGAIQSLLKDLRKATRKAGEEMNSGFTLVLVW